MHRSRLTTVVIDCAEDDFERGVEFWSRALGKPALDQDDPRYKSLRGRVGGEGGPYLLLQRVSRPERAIHLDIETDDVAAEVARVVGLGARVLEERDGYTILTDPGGMVFCVVPVQSGDHFARHATTWR